MTQESYDVLRFVCMAGLTLVIFGLIMIALWHD